MRSMCSIRKSHEIAKRSRCEMFRVTVLLNCKESGYVIYLNTSVDRDIDDKTTFDNNVSRHG